MGASATPHMGHTDISSVFFQRRKSSQPYPSGPVYKPVTTSSLRHPRRSKTLWRFSFLPCYARLGPLRAKEGNSYNSRSQTRVGHYTLPVFWSRPSRHMSVGDRGAQALTGKYLRAPRVPPCQTPEYRGPFHAGETVDEIVPGNALHLECIAASEA